MPRTDEFLRAGYSGRPVGVDRKAGVLRGYVVAQLGPFKSDGRGEFDLPALEEIVKLGNSATPGLKSRFSHPTECDDGLGKYLGRARNFALDRTIARDGKGTLMSARVRADLHFDPTALDTPPNGGKPLGEYVMDLAESDPDALSSSLVLRVKREFRLNPDGTPQTGPDGEELPPLWRPLRLSASDIVDTGDAVDGLLSADLPNSYLWQGAQTLDRLFGHLSREELEERLSGWLGRYLDDRFGPPEQVAQPSDTDIRRRKLRMQRLRSPR